MLQPSTDSRYSPVAQVVEIGEEVAFISFDPPFGRRLLEPCEKTLQVSRVGIDRLGSAGESAQPNHKSAGRRHSTDSRVKVPPDPVSPTIDRDHVPCQEAIASHAHSKTNVLTS